MCKSSMCQYTPGQELYNFFLFSRPKIQHKSKRFKDVKVIKRNEPSLTAY